MFLTHEHIISPSSSSSLRFHLNVFVYTYVCEAQAHPYIYPFEHCTSYNQDHESHRRRFTNTPRIHTYSSTCIINIIYIFTLFWKMKIEFQTAYGMSAWDRDHRTQNCTVRMLYVYENFELYVSFDYIIHIFRKFYTSGIYAWIFD